MTNNVFGGTLNLTQPVAAAGCLHETSVCHLYHLPVLG